MRNISANLRLNMTGSEQDPALRSKRYQTAIDMAAYADQQGFASVNVEEHHLAENGWLPSPLTMAAAIAARTERCSIGVMVLLVTLYDPIFLVGGMSKPAVRRAARLGLPFAPPVADPVLEAYYFEQLEKHGQQGFVHSPPEDFSVLFVHENPDQAWDELGVYLMNEAVEYSSWKTEGVNRPLEFNSNSVAALRAEKRYEIITPGECRRRHREREDFFAAIHPLIGGMPLDRAWECLQLYSEQVLAPLREE